MPPRVSRGPSTSARPLKSNNNRRAPKKAQKRALDAFAIASHEHGNRVKSRSTRLGELDVSSRRKRHRDEANESEGDEDEDEEVKRGKRRRAADEDIDEGSDSEGNTWKMGHVDEDDDSDIDSDEAFGESDEERFEGWTFRGSSGNQYGGRSRKAHEVDDAGSDIDLEEGESEEEDEDEDDLGDDAIDLATALDQYEESDEEEERQREAKKNKKRSAFEESDSDDAPSEVGDFAADGASDFSSDEDDEDEKDRRAQLNDLISSLAAEDEQKQGGRRTTEVHEAGAPSEYGVFRKVDLSSLKPKVADPVKKKALKLLQDDKPSKRNDIARKLDAPLPKRQQDKLDRAVASQKANETLERWTDTVKHNRRAEHLSFPLPQPKDSTLMGESRLVPTTAAAPTNDLESTIQSILQQSGLSNGKDDEEHIQKWEELQTNKLPLEEVMKRRAQLRKERELLFREEVRAKRIKKIKSKAYRRVHRKEREKLVERERNALKADGIDVSEDEREYNDRRRAEERMGAKHRESKWAKGVKATGRAAWDEDARSGVTEMARRNEELRRRIEGKAVRDEDEDASDFSSDENEDEDDDEDDDQVTQKQLSRLKENPFSTGQSKLGSMAFMQKAEAARKARNDEDVERMRKELAGEESNSDEEDENAARRGRRKFAPGVTAVPAIHTHRSDFEEMPASDDEGGDDRTTKAQVGHSNGFLQGLSNGSTKSSTGIADSENASQNPYLVKATKSKKSKPYVDLASQALDTITLTQSSGRAKKPKKSGIKSSQASLDHGLAGNPRVSAADDDGWQTVTYQNHDGDEEEDGLENEGIDLDVVLRNQALTASAFAGDNIEKEFEEEKKATTAQEDEHIEENELPGWGAWTGDGLSKHEKRKKGLVTVTKKEGIAPSKRKDAKLAKVIVNEKRVKANVKYMSSQLPFGFETKDQYERSLRLPKGPEWTTKKTFQDATKPRVLVKQGVIRPMHKPIA